ncbi:MAG: IclR family transcriptional regulator, partial [Mesorhizobium sp.]
MQTAGVFNLSTPVLGSDGRAIAALSIPYITLVNAPKAPDINKTIELLLAATEKLSHLAGSAVNSK